MRFIHIADLHLGKRLNETDMSQDIEYALFKEALGRIYDEVSQEQPDKPIEALVISGDVFDKKLPTADAEEMFGRLLFTAVEKKLKVFCVSGNHDSARRMAANEQLLSRLGVYISPEFTADEPFRVIQLDEGIDVALLPFISLPDVHEAYPDEEINDMTTAVEFVLKKAGLPGKRTCILVAHQAVTKSGTGIIGAEECVKSSVFSGFAYTALGHIHAPADVDVNVRYCGSPVCFSGSEAQNPQKYVDIVDVEPDGKCSVQHREINPLHRFRIIKDSFQRLMSAEYSPTDDYCYITVTDTDGAVGVSQQLRGKFSNLMKITYPSDRLSDNDEESEQNDEEFTFSSEFSRFCRDYSGGAPDDCLMKAAEYIFELTEKAFSDGAVSDLMQGEPKLSDRDNDGGDGNGN